MNDADQGQAIIDWLAANGVDVNQVPVFAKASLGGNRLVIEMFRCDRNGVITNPVSRVTRTFVVTTPPPWEAE